MTRIGSLIRLAINMRAAQIADENEPSDQHQTERKNAEVKFDVTLFQTLDEPNEELTPDPRAKRNPF